ncbi:MAG TPA: ABC transporter permease [Tissierellaceae bacterium]|nr:ABC transporter permease [Tissierellaceae bacterium]
MSEKDANSLLYDKSINDERIILKKQSIWSEAWRRYKKSKTAMFGLIVLSFIILAIIIGTILIDETLVTQQNSSDRFHPSSLNYWFGADGFGRDIFARIVYGGRASLAIGFGSSFLALITGGTLGLLVGYYGGRFDNIVMRLVDIIISIPPILLSLAIVSALGATMTNLIIAITISRIPSFVRVIRSGVMGVTDNEYIEAAHSGGTSDFRIIFRHILPNVMSVVIVETTMSMSQLLLQAATLSFLGLGIQPPSPEWGAMLSEAREFMRIHPMLMVYPGIAIVFSTLSLSLIGDGLRDAFDPRLRT